MSINAFTTGNPWLGTKLLGFSIGRDLGAWVEYREGFGGSKGVVNPRVSVLAVFFFFFVIPFLDSIPCTPCLAVGYIYRYIFRI